MSEINQKVTNSRESVGKRALRGLGRMASNFAMEVQPAPAKGRLAEPLSFFDAPAPELPLAAELDRLDALADEEHIAISMSRIEIHKTDA